MQFKRTLVAVAGAVIATSAFADLTAGSSRSGVPDNTYNKVVPLQNWSPATLDLKQPGMAGKTRKAATDFATVFRPITPCRLIDTRPGQPSAQGDIGGTIVGGAGTRRTVNLTTSPCGIPNISEVKALSLAFAVFNNTPNNGGFLAFTSPAAAPTGFNLIFSPGQQWLSTTAAVVTGGTGGDFDVFATTSVVDVIVDVNGYFQDMGELDVGTQQLDIHGNTFGDTLGVDNAGSGTALSVFSATATGGTSIRTFANGTGGKALDLTGGKFNVSGANTPAGTNFVYLHQVTPASLVGVCAAIRTNLDHPMLNGNPNAAVFAMPFHNTGGPPPAVQAVELVAGAGNSCTAQNHWRLVVTNPVVGSFYSIFIVTNN